MLKLNAKLQLPSHGGILALHWYEWDTLGYAPGSNYTKCDRTPPAVAHMSPPPVPTPPVPTPPVPCPPELTRAVSAESPHDHALHDHAVPGPQRCGFDTHYPNYFPARVGCKEAVHAMQAAGEWVLSVCQLIQIHTFPDLYLSLFTLGTQSRGAQVYAQSPTSTASSLTSCSHDMPPTTPADSPPN
jgi:hypothetical protein